MSSAEQARSALVAWRHGLLCVPGGVVAVLLARLEGGRLPNAHELGYLSSLGVALGAAVGLIVGIATWLSRRSKHHGSRLALLFLVAASSPFAIAFARHLSLASSRWDPIRPVLPYLVGACGVGAVLAVWGVQAMKAPVRRTALCLVMAVGLFAADYALARRRSALAPLTLGCSAATFGIAFRILLDDLAARRRRLALLVLLPALVAGIGLFDEERFLEGRRRALIAETSLVHLAARLPVPQPVPLMHTDAVAMACAPQPAVAQSATERDRPEAWKNVVIITIDTVRNDDARATVNGRLIMPNLVRFMGHGVTPPYAVTGYPATMMALASAFTGTSASGVILRDGTVPSAFRVLMPHVDEAVVAFPATSYFARSSVETLIVQGARRLPRISGRKQTNAAIAEMERLRKSNKRHVLWLHYFEPHAPYKTYEKFDHFGSDDRGRYRSELAAVDFELGRMLRALRKSGAYEDTLIVVFSDHGESFGEHGHRHHHFHLYPWLVRVPFSMHVPGRPPTKLPPVHLMDVAATLYDFMGARAPIALDGVSLLRDVPTRRALVSEEFPVRVPRLEAYARAGLPTRQDASRRMHAIELGPGYASKIALTTSRSQLVVHRATGVVEHFDLADDPGVTRDLGGVSARGSSLFAEYGAWTRRASARAGCAPTP